MRKTDTQKHPNDNEPAQIHQFNCNRCERFLLEGERAEVNGTAYCLTCLIEVVDLALEQCCDDDPPPTLH